MRKLLLILIAFAFLVRGFVGDAMAVAMIDSSLPSAQAVTATAEKSASAMCHEMGMEQGTNTDTGKTSADDNKQWQCQWCCVMATVPATLVFNIGVFKASTPVVFTPSFSSNALLPAFKPPIL